MIKHDMSPLGGIEFFNKLLLKNRLVHPRSVEMKMPHPLFHSWVGYTHTHTHTIIRIDGNILCIRNSCAYTIKLRVFELHACSINSDWTIDSDYLTICPNWKQHPFSLVSQFQINVRSPHFISIFVSARIISLSEILIVSDFGD